LGVSASPYTNNFTENSQLQFAKSKKIATYFCDLVKWTRRNMRTTFAHESSQHQIRDMSYSREPSFYIHLRINADLRAKRGFPVIDPCQCSRYRHMSLKTRDPLILWDRDRSYHIDLTSANHHGLSLTKGDSFVSDSASSSFMTEYKRGHIQNS
jgi:hypothetical protein